MDSPLRMAEEQAEEAHLVGTPPETDPGHAGEVIPLSWSGDT